jgi:hypothetical protein
VRIEWGDASRGVCVGGRTALGAMAVEVSVGYVRWVGVWARAWEGRAARGAQSNGRLILEREWDGRMGDWRGSGMGGRGDSGTIRARR